MGKPGALPHLYSGKVRELYEVAYDQLLIVASDRVSVFDVVLPDEIPDKGRVLTGVSQFWFDQTAGIVPNHVISCDPTDFPPTAGAVGGPSAIRSPARRARPSTPPKPPARSVEREPRTGGTSIPPASAT